MCKPGCERDAGFTHTLPVTVRAPSRSPLRQETCTCIIHWLRTYETDTWSINAALPTLCSLRSVLKPYIPGVLSGTDCCVASGIAMGKVIGNVVPLPGVLCTSMTPSWAAMISRATYNPSVVHSEPVVWKGSKSVARCSSEMPLLVSLTWTITREQRAAPVASVFRPWTWRPTPAVPG